MFEDISKNWGYLTTFGAIVAAVFVAGIWMANALNTLEKLPPRVDSIEDRLIPLENMPEIITQETCVRTAETEMAINEAKIFFIDLKVAEIREQVFALKSATMDQIQQQEKDWLQDKDRKLISQRKDFKSEYDRNDKNKDGC